MQTLRPTLAGSAVLLSQMPPLGAMERWPGRVLGPRSMVLWLWLGGQEGVSDSGHAEKPAAGQARAL